MEKLILSLPVSVNKAFTWNPRMHFFVHTNEYTNYLEYESLRVKSYCKRHKIKPINCYTPLYLYFYLKNPRSDSHNCKKVLFDSLEQGGMFENDKWILDRTMEVQIDKKNPRVEIYLSI